MYSTTIGLTALQRVHSGRPVADALAEEAETLGARRVFVVASHTLNTTTDEIEKIRRKLGARLAGVFDRVRPHVLFFVRGSRTLDLGASLAGSDEVVILQALSGG